MCGLFQKMKLTQKTRRWMRKPRVLRRDRLEFSYLSVNKIVIAIVLSNSSLFCFLLGKAMRISELISVIALVCCDLYYS